MVDLPAPFSPSTAWISPGLTRRLTRSLAFTAGYRLLMSISSESQHVCLLSRSAAVSFARRSRRRPRGSARHRASASANTFSCKPRATSMRRSATGPAAQSHTQKVGRAPGLQRSISLRSARATPRVAALKRPSRRSADAGAPWPGPGIGHGAQHGWTAGATAHIAGSVTAEAAPRAPPNRPLPGRGWRTGRGRWTRPPRDDGAVGVVQPDAVGQHRRLVRRGRRGS